MKRHPKKPLISLLVPFRAHPESDRAHIWNWLKEYWEQELPEAEIIMGFDDSVCDDEPFSKTIALNNAFRKSKGDIIVMLDADGYIDGEKIRLAAKRIRAAVARGERLWYVPYQRFWRMNYLATQKVLRSDQEQPHRFSCPPNLWDIDYKDYDPFRPVDAYGKRYGALMIVAPREAIEIVNGWDERFRGWGGEDVCFLRAVDTLYAKHHALPGCVYHLYHRIVGNSYETRKWSGQKDPQANNELSLEYGKAYRDKATMERIVAFNQLPLWRRQWRKIWKCRCWWRFKRNRNEKTGNQ